MKVSDISFIKYDVLDIRDRNLNSYKSMANSTKQIFKNFPIVKVYVTSLSIK